MISTHTAAQIIYKTKINTAKIYCNLNDACGKILAENILADRDFPSFNRVTMDGIALKHHTLINTETIFKSNKIQYAGKQAETLTAFDECIEVMTGSVLPIGTDTVVRYEDLEEEKVNKTETTFRIKNSEVMKGQNIHYQGSDKKQSDILIAEDKLLTAADIALLASAGRENIKIKKTPTIAVIATGDELVETEQIPENYQIRASNNLMIASILKEKYFTCDTFLCKDSLSTLNKLLETILQQYDVIILTGAVSKGKTDYLPQVLEKLNVKKLFHGVAQRPGKPMWFGQAQSGNVVFALPGNPVSATVCTYVYLLPWLKQQLGNSLSNIYAKLTEQINFIPALTYFLQVKISFSKNGEILATPYPGNGSGDLTNLSEVDGFLELPAEKSSFEINETYPIYFIREVW